MASKSTLTRGIVPIISRRTAFSTSSLLRPILSQEQPRPAARIFPQQLPHHFQFQQRRWHTAPANGAKQYTFEDIKSLTTSPSPKRILIDVREPSEYTPGHIPTARNLPVKTSPDALFLPASEFEDRYGFPKPDPKEQEVVFYCRAGVRSSVAAKLAEQAGYERVGEYRGSWLDWEKRGGEQEK